MRGKETTGIDIVDRRTNNLGGLRTGTAIHGSGEHSSEGPRLRYFEDCTGVTILHLLMVLFASRWTDRTCQDMFPV